MVQEQLIIFGFLSLLQIITKLLLFHDEFSQYSGLNSTRALKWEANTIPRQ